MKVCTDCEVPHQLRAGNSYRGQCKVHIQQLDAKRYRERYAELIKERRMIRNKIIADHYAASTTAK